MRPELVAEGGCAREAMRSDLLLEVGICFEDAASARGAVVRGFWRIRPGDRGANHPTPLLS
jgi:hypothetical protein